MGGAKALILKSKLVKFSVSAFFVFLVFLHWYISRMTINPNYGKVFYKLGLECQGKCNFNKQLEYFKKAVFYDPNLTDAHYQLGVNYGKRGQNEKEFMSYKKVTTLDHTHADAYLKVG